MHTRHRRSARLHYMSTCARTRARYTCTAATHTPDSSAVCPATSCSAAARSTAASRRVGPPPLAVARSPPRRSRRRERLHCCCRCRRCRGTTRLYAYHGRCRRQGTCESRTGDSDDRPTPAPGPGVGRSVVDVGREQRAGRRARRVGGVPTSAADGTRAQKPWRMVRDDSPSSRTDHPAHAWAVRGLDVTGSEHHDEEKHGRVGGTAGACGTVGSQN